MEKIFEGIYRFTAGGDNAYLIKGETNVLIDGVREEYAEEYISAVAKTAPFSDIKYIVINHSEPNRSGTLRAVLRENPDITVIASTAGLKFLSDLIDGGFHSMLAKDGMEMEINGGKMKFTYVPYMNWPDSMVTLYKNALFTCDLFDGESEFSEKYIDAAVEEIKKLDYKHILPGSGDFFGEHGPTAVFSVKNKRDTALILYSSVYGTTREMAEIVEKSLGGIKTEMYDIADIDEITAAEKINKCRALILGVNTINGDAPKKLWSIIGRTDKQSNKGKPCMMFGSRGWGGEGLYYIEHHLKMLRYDVYKKPFAAALRLKDADRAALKKFAAEFAEHIG